MVWSCLALVTAVICRQLDIAGRFTGPDTWLQGHALWHILTSLSLGCIYLYSRSEGTAADRAVKVRRRLFQRIRTIQTIIPLAE
jgi:hypothetical protein